MVHLVASCYGSPKDVCYLNFVNAHAINRVNVINVNNAIFRKRISVFCSVIQLLGNSDHRTIHNPLNNREALKLLDTYTHVYVPVRDT